MKTTLDYKFPFPPSDGKGVGGCQCAGCGRLFTSVYGFDRHRINDKSTDKRRCMTEEELEGSGMEAKVRSWTKKESAWGFPFWVGKYSG